MPAISVIVPVYKVETYIYRCIDSILSQTFRDFELILVDDGSRDKCGDICDEYAKQDNRIQVIHQKNGGLSAARNTGIGWSLKYSDSEWLNFIDSDDYVHPRYLETLYSIVKGKNVLLASCNYAMTKGEDLEVDEENKTVRLLTSKQYYCENAVSATVAWGKLYQKHLFDNIRFPVGRYHEDEFTTYKLLFKCKKIGVISQPLYAYYQNHDGITHSVPWSKLTLHKIDALSEQIDYFRVHHCTTAEMQRLIICIDKLKQVRTHSDLFSENELNHIQELRNKLFQQYPNILFFSDFIIKNKRYKTLFPIFYYLYKQYTRLHK